MIGLNIPFFNKRDILDNWSCSSLAVKFIHKKESTMALFFMDWAWIKLFSLPIQLSIAQQLSSMHQFSH
jgi:hypothetical protein